MSSANSPPVRGPGAKNSDVEVGTQHIEVMRTISKVPANPNYHEKNGLRTEGDGVDHTKFNYVSTAGYQFPTTLT